MAIARFIEFRVWNAPLAQAIPEKPKASAVSRQEGRVCDKATSLLHLSVGLADEKLRALLQLLDGTRTRSELLEAMAAEFKDVPLPELERGLGNSIENFHRSGVLEA
jgi:hypothetical protein